MCMCVCFQSRLGKSTGPFQGTFLNIVSHISEGVPMSLTHFDQMMWSWWLFCKINDNTFSLYVSVYLEPFGKTTGPILMNIFRNSFRKINDYDWILSNLIKIVMS